MSGIFGAMRLKDSNASEKVTLNTSYRNYCGDDLVNGFIGNSSFYVERHLNKRFINDKVFQENKNHIAVIDGVIINMASLIAKYSDESFFECLVKMYKKNGDYFFKELKGNFCGVFADKKAERYIVFNNVIGTKSVYYSLTGGKLLFSSDIGCIVNYFKHNNIKYTFDEKSAWVMIKYPHLPDDFTFFKEIRRLVHSHCIIVDKGSLRMNKYHEFDVTPSSDYDEGKTIDKIDTLFRQLVGFAFEKDVEYGYKHIATLSAGLDSKIVTWVAHELGYGDNIWNITYSQPDFWDETVPKEMTSDLGHKWTFHSLANGLLSMNIEECVRLNGGSYYFAGIAQGHRAFNMLNLDGYGMLHTGLASDILSGRVYGTRNTETFNIREIYYNNRLNHVFTEEDEAILKNRYANNEMFQMQTIANNSENTQQIGLEAQTEIYSPFFDVELTQIFLSVPVLERLNRKLYIKWLVSKYPDASAYVYDRAGIPLMSFYEYGGEYIIDPKAKKLNMNPTDYWYANSRRYREALDSYYNENIGRLPEHNEMRQRAALMYNGGSCSDKLRIVTILAVLKNYFN